ncbi:MAG: hypothetical protein WCD86_05390 [Ktedonobacteraceae bacterium]
MNIDHQKLRQWAERHQIGIHPIQCFWESFRAYRTYHPQVIAWITNNNEGYDESRLILKISWLRLQIEDWPEGRNYHIKVILSIYYKREPRKLKSSKKEQDNEVNVGTYSLYYTSEGEIEAEYLEIQNPLRFRERRR